MANECNVGEVYMFDQGCHTELELYYLLYHLFFLKFYTQN